jgi:hypothetical protein
MLAATDAAIRMPRVTPPPFGSSLRRMPPRIERNFNLGRKNLKQRPANPLKTARFTFGVAEDGVKNLANAMHGLKAVRNQLNYFTR